jgi:hypothetical protein
MSAKREQHRRFGEYHGEDGIETTAANTQSIWNASPCTLQLFLLIALFLS